MGTVSGRRLQWRGELPCVVTRPQLPEWVASVGAPCHVGWVPRGLETPEVAAMLQSALPVQDQHVVHGGELWHAFITADGAWAVAISRGGHCSPVWWSRNGGFQLWLEITGAIAEDLELEVMNDTAAAVAVRHQGMRHAG